MTEVAGFGTGWLPAGVQRRMAVEEQAERREARAAELERAEQAEQAHDKALGAYRAAAEARGETVSALALATGQGIGRSIEDVFADARLAADREDGRAAARRRHEDGDVVFIDREPRIQGASRSSWPSSSYEADRQLRQADQLHRDLVQTQSRMASRRGQAAEHVEAERAKAQRAHVRDLRPGAGTDITRYAPTPACDRCGHVRCECR